jgi:hypothetical protein
MGADLMDSSLINAINNKDRAEELIHIIIFKGCILVMKINKSIFIEYLYKYIK